MKMHIQYFLVAILTVSIWSCKENNSESKVTSETQDNTIIITRSQFESSGFTLGKVGTHRFIKKLPIKGTIAIPETAISVVSTQYSGKVSEMNLHKDTYVNKGQRLFTLTNPSLISLQEEYLVTKQQMVYLKEELERQEALAKENLTLKSTLAKVKADLENAIIRNASVQKQLDMVGINVQNLSASNLTSSIAVRAPQSGYISDILIHNGAILDGNQMALKIINPAQAYLELHVLEKEVPYVNVGQEITFKVGSNQEKIYPAKVTSIGKIVNNDHLVTIKCEIEGRDKSNLLPGMYVDATLNIASADGKSLPIDAMVNMGGQHYVALLKYSDNNQFTFIPIKIDIGATDEEKIEITSDIDLNQTYLTKGTYYIIQ